MLYVVTIDKPYNVFLNVQFFTNAINMERSLVHLNPSWSVLLLSWSVIVPSWIAVLEGFDEAQVLESGDGPDGLGRTSTDRPLGE